MIWLYVFLSLVCAIVSGPKNSLSDWAFYASGVFVGLMLAEVLPSLAKIARDKP